MDYIGDYAFYRCSNINSITLPSTVKEIGAGAFEDCENILSLALNEGLETIGRSAFRGAFSDATVSYKLVIPSTVKEIGDNGFESCLGITGLVLNDSLETIGMYAFSDCENLTGTVSIPSTMREISSNAFRGTDLKNVEIGEGVEIIGAYTFEGCNSLETVYIPDTVQYIYQSAFETESDSIYIYYEGDTIPSGWQSNWINKGVNYDIGVNSRVFLGTPKVDYDAIVAGTFDVAEPVISTNGGIATITCDTPFAYIYYTLNGNDPVEDYDCWYNGSFYHGDNTCKAFAYVGRGIYSEISEVHLRHTGGSN